MRIVVLDGFTTDQGQPGWAELRALGGVEVHPRTRREELVARTAGADALLTNKVVIDDAIMGALPALRYIGVLATGTNVVDLAAARRRGVAVTNVPGYATASVAELVFALVLHLARDVAGHAADVKAGRWASAADFSFCRGPTTELAGKTLVVVGRGAIGQAVGRIAAAFGMEIVYAAAPGSAATDRVSLDDALPRADVVTLHCPLTPRTQRLVDAAFLARLRPTAILVNTGRGGLVDEDHLLAALRAGRLGGVALDVLTEEPPPPAHPLLDPSAPWAARVIVTPHLAWATVEARARLQREVALNLAAFLRGERRNRVA